MTAIVNVKKLHERAIVPQYKTPGAAGFDIHALHGGSVQAGWRATVDTGLAFEIPEGFEVQIRPRSGLADKHGITVLNSPGTIDSDYRGEVRVMLINNGFTRFTWEPGERIAQGVLAPVIQGTFHVKEELSETERGAGGFGSTGVK